MTLVYGFGPDENNPQKWKVWWEQDNMRLEMGPFDTFKEVQTFGFHFHDLEAKGWKNVFVIFTEARKLFDLSKKLNAATKPSTPESTAQMDIPA